MTQVYTTAGTLTPRHCTRDWQSNSNSNSSSGKPQTGKQETQGASKKEEGEQVVVTNESHPFPSHECEFLDLRRSPPR